MNATPATEQHGIALVIVLWVVALLTVIVSSFVLSARTQVLIGGNQVALAKARAYADAGVHRAIHEMSRPVADGERWRADGRTHSFTLDDARVRVTTVDESAFIDLNNAQAPLLVGLFRSAGVEEGDAIALVDAIQDWRDNDDLARPSGAERDDYRAAGLKHVPANANFRTIDELKSVLGMTPEIYAGVAGALTVHSGSAGFNPALAPRQVLMAIPDVDPAAVETYLADRQAALEEGLPPPLFPPAAAFSGGAGGVVYNFRSEATLAGGEVFVREAVVRLTGGDSSHPYAFLDWREDRPRPAARTDSPVTP